MGLNVPFNGVILHVDNTADSLKVCIDAPTFLIHCCVSMCPDSTIPYAAAVWGAEGSPGMYISGTRVAAAAMRSYKSSNTSW